MRLLESVDLAIWIYTGRPSGPILTGEKVMILL
jgi:hypothetical protein